MKSLSVTLLSLLIASCSNGSSTPAKFRPKPITPNGLELLREVAFGRSRPVPRKMIAAADVDGDGDQDIVIGQGGAQNRLLLNDGHGQFTDATANKMPNVSDVTTCLLLVDVDGDGDPDLVVGNGGELNVPRSYNRPNAIYLNDGSGGFHTAGNIIGAASNTNRILAADVDLDGDIDLIEENTGRIAASNREVIYVNDGKGNLTSDPKRLGRDAWGSVAAADIDGDGDVDLLFTPNVQIYLNDGKGFYSEGATLSSPTVSRSSLIRPGDVDGDGDQDLLVTTGTSQGWQADLLYLNDGLGAFSLASADDWPSVEDWTGDLTLADLDGDNDLDVIVDSVGIDRIYLNHGNGKFSHFAGLIRGSSSLTGVVADADGDGDLDLVTSTAWYKNLSRDVSATDAPKIGQDWAVTCTSRPAGPPTALSALLMLGTRLTKTTHPQYGTLWLDPSTAFVTPTQLTSPSTATAEFTFRIPTEPMLVGLDLYAQGLVVTQPGTTPKIRATNAWMAKVR